MRRVNRLAGCQLEDEKSLAKRGRGSVDAKEGKMVFGRFLKNQELRFPLFPCTYDWKENLLTDVYDVNGVVLELSQLQGIQLALPYLTMPPPTPANVKLHFHMLIK